ncbi:CaiB/BaiF CoA transferase family protein [Dactylosporangium sp. CA-092794]|uniref:CaiB/BaiF CoA transferase family protein n=1 Tax=Dactylosporangium sp. CA-092794 TaxID=3239929 RepID=UPI003D94588F
MTFRLEPQLSHALSGVRVVDLTRNLAGPFCTMLLADLGADVIKIERPGTGDDTRGWQPPSWNGESATFLSANRNKRSIAVDLNRPEGQDLVRRLLRGADVLVESFRPGSLRQRGLDAQTLRTAAPRLIYCSISAYGDRGPKRHRPGYDPVLQADTGIMDLTGYPEEPPARVGIGAIDLGAALWASIGIQAALMQRDATGAGSHIQTSLFETATWWMSYHLVGYLATGQPPGRQGTGTPFIAPYETFPTADGDLLVAAANDGLFAGLIAELGLPAIGGDARFATNPARVRHRGELRALLAPAFLLRTAAAWERLLTKRGIPCSRVRTVADLAADPQLDALGMLVPYPHPAVPGLRLVPVPVSLDGGRGATRNPPPRLGEHTDAVLDELDIDAATRDRWRRQGVVA